jgi:hypothetical protein
MCRIHKKNAKISQDSGQKGFFGYSYDYDILEEAPDFEFLTRE